MPAPGTAPNTPLKIAVLGAARTGRSHLARALAVHLRECGHRVGVDEAAGDHDIVIADITASPTLGTYDLTLLMGLDLPAVDADASREQIDTQLRETLTAAGADWRVVYGRDDQRTRNALEAVAAVAPWAWQPPANPADTERWARLKASCEKCGDASCEHRLFTGLIAPPT